MENLSTTKPLATVEAKPLDKTFIAPRSVATVALPSRGYFYSDTAIKNGNVEITPLTARDMKLVAGITGKNVDDVVDTLLKRCVISNVDPDDLLTADRYFLLIMLRANSFGSGVNITVQCPHDKCKKINSLVLDLIKDYSVVSVKEGVKEPFRFVLPQSKLEVTYRLPRGKDVKLVEAMVAKIKSETKEDAIADNTLTVAVAMLINTINGVSVPEESRVAAVDTFPASDFFALKRDMDANTPMLTSSTTKKCLHCGNEIEVGSPLQSAEFFYPLS